MTVSTRLGRFAGRARERALRGAVAAREAEGPLERELLEGDVDAYKEDVFAAGGDGTVLPTLPTVPPGELFEEFEGDEAAPRDPAA